MAWDNEDSDSHRSFLNPPEAIAEKDPTQFPHDNIRKVKKECDCDLRSMRYCQYVLQIALDATCIAMVIKGTFFPPGKIPEPPKANLATR
jgi:hypothetical protein